LLGALFSGRDRGKGLFYIATQRTNRRAYQMAISFIEYHVMRSMQEQGLLPRGGDLLELGEAQWYGDVALDDLRADILQFAPPAMQQPLLAQLEAATKSQQPNATWDMAKIFWQIFLQPSSMTAIDFNGTETARKLDLNYPIELERQYHIVNNCGTLEHVFNIGQAFKTVHDVTRPGGFMIHHTPFVGWIDHGFYALNPTLFWDLAAVNDYHVCVFLYAELNPLMTVNLHTREKILEMAKNNEIGKNAVLAAVLRRPDVALEFRAPVQGYYAGRVSRSAADAWSVLR
jgi:hypothetical protein